MICWKVLHGSNWALELAWHAVGQRKCDRSLGELGDRWLSANSNVLYLEVTMVEKSSKTTIKGVERLSDVANLVVGRSKVANSR
jgi:hypothetical protein